MDNNKFNEFFEQVYGDRWPRLKNALSENEVKVLRETHSQKTISEFEKLDDNNRNKLQGSEFYAMDPASIIAARALEVQLGDIVLDMCSAPGGKALILNEALNNTGELHLNEISKNRREKLKNVIRQYVDEGQRQHLKFHGKDAVKFGLLMPNTFNRILLDAPCSGERHLIKTPKELKSWTIKRTKRLSGIQYGLICSALLALKPGGTLVYSTCSISPMENDDVIEKLHKKKGDSFELNLPDSVDGFERTKFGYLALPDNADFGPIYFSKIQKSQH